MKRLASIFILTSLMALMACGGGGDKERVAVKTPDAVKLENKASSSAAATDPMTDKGVGTITNVELAAIDEGLVAEGQELFSKNCTACHKTDKKYIGPALHGVTERRTPEWIMNMILDPTNMIQKDPIAKQLVGENNGAVMADQNLTEEQARAILEYFRTLNPK